MKFSEKWLREWVNPPVSATELADQLTMAGLEVEGISASDTGFKGVVTAKILNLEKHPRADNLLLCTVDDGTDRVKVICGARNARAGGIYPYAQPGSVLPGNVKIRKARIKGIYSCGMLCSGAELGLDEESELLMELDAGIVPGMPLEQYLALDDQIIELSLTANRGDCLSILGIAREVAVIHEMPIKLFSIPPVKPTSKQTRNVRLQAPEGCPRYAGRVITGVDLNRRSPVWMKERLRRSGIRSINIAVDITNYVMLELGQPMHAFDLDTLRGGISVRYARNGEKLTTLDEAELELNADTLVIADDSGAIAIAGIMGGLDTAVTSTTQNIFLESAYFSPEVIAGRPRRYGLHTDSSHRFERGVDYCLQVMAIERATQLVTDLCGGSAGPVIDVTEPASMPARQTVALRVARLEELLGVSIEKAEIAGILQRLGLETEEDTDGWKVTVPSYRFDIRLEVDLIEEIARIYGYQHIPVAPIDAKLRIRGIKRIKDNKELHQILVARGYHEVVTYSFVDAALQNMLKGGDFDSIHLVNPISSELGILRSSLWPGLLTTLLFNLKRQQQRVRIFESGWVFSRLGDEIRQELRIAGLINGKNYQIQWDIENNLSDFYDIKGDLEALMPAGDRTSTLTYSETRHPALHPGRSAEIIIEKQSIGFCGEIHPEIMYKMDINNPAYVFELDLARITGLTERIFKKISKYPSVRRDISILVNREIPVASIMEAIKAASPILLDNLELFDVYHGEGIDILKKSLALGLTFQASSSTLIDEEVEGEVENILAALNSKFDVRLRE